MHSELPAAPGTRMPEHRLSISERGSFAYATCSCGWYAPARRSRDLARREGADHLAENSVEPD
ncbi:MULTISPECIES: hypothetical protein [unclassified Streptomyces]|uniref:hypothetical protein n=1 Tax=unclassified Streptomyces TaxID=2593676 RepID=UPI0015CF31BC|nr:MULTISPECIES: hypothetical protein [unclassified Streptomyces]